MSEMVIQSQQLSAHPITARRLAGRATLKGFVRIKDSSVRALGRELNLKRCLMILRVYKLFHESIDGEVSRLELMHALYPTLMAGTLSSRLDHCINQNVVKMVSRSRDLAAQTFGAGPGAIADWFQYDSSRRVWQFYRLRNDVIVAGRLAAGLEHSAQPMIH